MGSLGHLNRWYKSLREQAGCGGKVGRKSGGRTGPAPLRHGWGRGRVPMIRGGHSQCGNQWGQEETFREPDGNVASISPMYLRPGEPAGVTWDFSFFLIVCFGTFWNLAVNLGVCLWGISPNLENKKPLLVLLPKHVSHGRPMLRVPRSPGPWNTSLGESARIITGLDFWLWAQWGTAREETALQLRSHLPISSWGPLRSVGQLIRICFKNGLKQHDGGFCSNPNLFQKWPETTRWWLLF